MEICHQLLEQIKKYDTIIIHRHMRADPDALGSQVGLKELLQYNFPDKKIKVVGYDLPTLTWLAKMDEVEDQEFEGALAIICDTANTARIDDKRYLNARIEPGAIIRDQVTIEDNAVVMMGAVINIGAEIGAGTMIDMGAILGGRATVGKNSHIGAGAVLAGVIEPASAEPVRIGDNVLVGANAVVIEGVQVGNGSVVAAGAIVTQDVPENVVVAGVPARIIKEIDEKTQQKTALEDALRNL